MPTKHLIGALDGTGHGLVLEQDVPEVTKGTVFIKVHASLISAGTELSVAKGRRTEPATDVEPQTFGYQNAGEVIEVGEGVMRFKPGDRVAAMGGGMANHTNYAVVPQGLCFHLPENVSYEEGAFGHLAITSLNAVRRGEPQQGEYLVVVGLGVVGQMAARFGQLGGQTVMGWDLAPFRCEVARKWGIDGTTVVGEEDVEEKAAALTGGFGFDMAVMAFGGDGTKALESVKAVMRKRRDTHATGPICMVGGLKTELQWGASTGNLDLRSCARTGPGYKDTEWELGEYEYPPVLARWNTGSNMAYALRMMSEGKFDVKCLVTHRLPLAKIDEAVNAHIEDPNGTLGTVLLMDHDD